LETLIKRRKVGELMNLIDINYTIDNFDKELSILVIFYAFAHLGKSKKKVHHFGKKTEDLLSYTLCAFKFDSISYPS